MRTLTLPMDLALVEVAVWSLIDTDGRGPLVAVTAAVLQLTELLPMLQNHLTACMPVLVWLQLDLKTDTPVGVTHGHLIKNCIGNGAMEVLVVVGRAQLLTFYIPMR